MYKFTAVLGLCLTTLLWSSSTFAHSSKSHSNAVSHSHSYSQGKHGKHVKHGNKGHHASTTIRAGEELRDLGHREIREGKELISSGYHYEGKALIMQGTRDIQAGNRLIREGKSDLNFTGHPR